MRVAPSAAATLAQDTKGDVVLEFTTLGTRTVMLCTAAITASTMITAQRADAVTLLNAETFIRTPENNTRDEDDINISRDPLREVSARGADSASRPGTNILAWRVEAEARADFTSLKTRASWEGGNEATRPDGTRRRPFSGGGEAFARLRDEFTISGNGEIGVTYTLSGRVAARMLNTDPRDALERLVDSEVYFSLELDRRGDIFAKDRVQFESKIPFGSQDRVDSVFRDTFSGVELTATMDVSDGDIVDFDAFAESIAGTSGRPAPRMRESSASSDFFSTAELTNVFASDGVTFTAASGFNYFSVNSPVPDNSDDDTMTPIPLPASAWLLLGALGVLSGIRRRRIPAF